MSWEGNKHKNTNTYLFISQQVRLPFARTRADIVFVRTVDDFLLIRRQVTKTEIQITLSLLGCSRTASGERTALVTFKNKQHYKKQTKSTMWFTWCKSGTSKGFRGMEVARSDFPFPNQLSKTQIHSGFKIITLKNMYFCDKKVGEKQVSQLPPSYTSMHPYSRRSGVYSYKPRNLIGCGQGCHKRALAVYAGTFRGVLLPWISVFHYFLANKLTRIGS